MDQSCLVYGRALWVVQMLNQATQKLMKGLRDIINKLKLLFVCTNEILVETEKGGEDAQGNLKY